MSDADPANPSDEIAVFQTYIDLINSERETIWARHNALLVANSLIIGALAISPTALWAEQMGGSCHACRRPSRQRRVVDHHNSGMGGDAAA